MDRIEFERLIETMKDDCAKLQVGGHSAMAARMHRFISYLEAMGAEFFAVNREVKHVRPVRRSRSDRQLELVSSGPVRDEEDPGPEDKDAPPVA